MSTALRAAIIQDVTTREVLMLGWMDEEALALTRATGLVHFFSRSRQQLWRKGETSGHTLAVRSVTLDCDEDAVVVEVEPSGPTCHDGTTSCFTPWLWRRIVQRDNERADDSYVTTLMAGGPALAGRKVGEEAAEVLVATLSESDDRVISEVADLWFHTLVLLRTRGLDPSAVDAELRRRAQ
jgi:phosphoribosyl-AMP cyclohydrolase / phosphoribosyl-ATP pyrophosphohydrolase